jgi:hypothetical protein
MVGNWIHGRRQPNANDVLRLREFLQQQKRRQNIETAAAANLGSLQFHQLAEEIPLMAEAELRKLAIDIKENGLRDPIIIYEGRILDGRHRYLALRLNGHQFKGEEFSRYDVQVNGDPERYVISRNIKRRQVNLDISRLVANITLWLMRRSPVSDILDDATFEQAISEEQRNAVMHGIQPESLRTFRELRAILKSESRNALEFTQLIQKRGVVASDRDPQEFVATLAAVVQRTGSLPEVSDLEHEFAKRCPMMTEEHLQRLAEDIKKNGLLEKIVIHQGKILDGRHRYEALKRNGHQFTGEEFIEYKESNGVSAESYVNSRNVMRRQMPLEPDIKLGAMIFTIKEIQGRTDLSAQQQMDLLHQAIIESGFGVMPAGTGTTGTTTTAEKSPSNPTPKTKSRRLIGRRSLG